ncbi:hypothetical protein [uncultured Ligilactobacillus sp.]|uniref:hypothetical protein n=1 Tax=uncultured Ligilactobacillus sp. TaxID=2837633 RepID=UPI00272CD4F6|nr:hypothetical protein [uncultured Ligilactobacillus sp.]
MSKAEKLPFGTKLVIFSLVPLSQILLYFATAEQLQNKELMTLKDSLHLSATQLTVFQIVIVLSYSLISFGLMYLVGNFILNFSNKKNSEALFISLVLAIGIANSLALIVVNLFGMLLPWLPALCQVVIVTFSYYKLSGKDKSGSLFLLGLMLVFNLGPVLFL